MKNSKLKVLAISLAILFSSSSGFASSDATTVAPGDATAAPAEVKIKKGFDWRGLYWVPVLWPVGVVLRASGWEPATIPTESLTDDGAATAAEVAQKKENSWGSDPWGAQ